jgi:hypothetical protein
MGGAAVRPASELNVGGASVVAGPTFMRAQREKPTDMGSQQGLDNLAAQMKAVGNDLRGGTTFFTPDHKTIQQDQFIKQSEGNARLQRSFLSPKDRKKLETDERRAYDRQFMGDKLQSAENIERTRAEAEKYKADQDRKKTEFPYGPDAKLSQTDAQGNVILAPGASTPPRGQFTKVRVPMTDPDNKPVLDENGKPIYTDALVDPNATDQQASEQNGIPDNPELKTVEDELKDAMGEWNDGQRYGGFLNVFPNYWKKRIADLQKRREEILKKSGRGGGSSLSPAQQVAQTEAALKAKGVTITPELRAEIRRRAGM